MFKRTSVLCGAALLAALPTAAHAIVSAAGDSAAHTFANDPAYRSVGGFLVSSPFTFGSGVLISPDYVLTAYHAVSGVSPSDLQFSFSLGGSTVTAQAAQIIQDTANPESDLAVVRLAAPVNNITPASVLQTNPSLIGLHATGIGYGQSGTPTGGNDNNSSLIGRGGTNVIDLYGRFVTNGNSTTFSGTTDPANSPTVNNQLGYDFDSGSAADNTLAPNSSPTPDTNEYALAYGDSGGALFATINGQQVLVGIGEDVTTGSDGNLSSYGSISSDTRLYDYLSFVDQYTPEPSSAAILLLTSAGLLRRRRR